MTEREQVIAELLYLKRDCLEGSATDQTIDKAIALLKAQEPRVLTVDELKTLNDGAVVWVEFSDSRLLPMIVDDGCLMRWGYLWRICEDAFCDDDYQARAWSSRPAEEQRKTVEWESTSKFSDKNCPCVCNTNNDSHACPDCLANADGADCRYFDSNGFCQSAACVAFTRECPFDVMAVRCEWFEIRETDK